GVEHREPDGIPGFDRARRIHGRQPAGRAVVPRPRLQRTEIVVDWVQLRAGDQSAAAAGAHAGAAGRSPGETMKRFIFALSVAALVAVHHRAAAQTQTQAAPSDVKPGSITCEECPYPYPSSYLPLTLYGQDVRIAYMNVRPNGTPNGHTVVLLHGN